MSTISLEEYRELLSGYSTQVLVGNWVVGKDAAAGVSQFDVVMAETATSTSPGTVPVVGASDAQNFAGSRIVFGRGEETAAPPSGPSATTGLNFGFSTTITNVATTGDPAVTTITVADDIPDALNAQDSFTIYRPLVVQIASPSSYDGTVGSGSTTTELVNSVGGWQANQWVNFGIEFTSNTTTPSLRDQWFKITANTDNTLTVSPDMPTAPVVGDRYNIRIYKSQVMNLQSVGGQAQTAADWTPLLQDAADVDAAVGTPGTAAPSKAVQVQGSDGTNGHTISTDDEGRLNLAPDTLVWDAAGLAVTANTNIFDTSYTPPSAGTITITIGNLATGSAAIAYLSKDANTAPNGGSAGTRIFAFNGGNALSAGNLYGYSFIVTANDTYNMQFGTDTTVDVTATFAPS